MDHHHRIDNPMDLTLKVDLPKSDNEIIIIIIIIIIYSILDFHYNFIIYGLI
jgi:predicted nucleic acid binding AN1-type Zn finger protein